MAFLRGLKGISEFLDLCLAAFQDSPFAELPRATTAATEQTFVAI